MFSDDEEDSSSEEEEEEGEEENDDQGEEQEQEEENDDEEEEEVMGEADGEVGWRYVRIERRQFVPKLSQIPRSDISSHLLTLNRLPFSRQLIHLQVNSEMKNKLTCFFKEKHAVFRSRTNF